jgi:hypothetical protein
MTRMITAALAVAALYGASVFGASVFGGSLFAHHQPSALGTVRIAQPVQAGGTVLQPGTYEVRLTGEHLSPFPGQSEDAGQRVEFFADGKVVARDVAEVMTAESIAVGTSGSGDEGASRARVDLLKGGDFMRVSVTRGGERYLIHLPVAR